jgi:thioredoxin 1
MAEGVLELNDDTFEDETKQGVTLVDFWAPWCGPCKMLTPIIEGIAAKIGDKAKITKVNIDDSPKVASKFGIRSIPTVVILKNGETVEQLVGLRKETDLLAAIDSAQ